MAWSLFSLGQRHWRSAWKRSILLDMLRRGNKLENRNIDERELCFDRIWEQLIRTGATRHRSDLKRSNVLVLQMAKVASTSIRSALGKRKINAFHCHGLSAARQERDLSRLRRADLTGKLIKRRLRQHLRYVCLHMMVRWYQKYNSRNGRKLKVITLTRDPVDRFASNFMQHRSTALPQIVSWQRARLGEDAAMPIDELQAVQDFVTELASVIVAGRPSAGAEACRACEALARERWPQHFIVEDEISEWLRPLTWFETEIEQVFGLDVLAAAELRERGWAEAHNDWVEILVLRFENLAKLTPEIGRFVHVTELVLPRRNVTKSKYGASDIMSAIQATLSTPIGQACAGELWKSRYARACGYPLPKGDLILGTGTITSQASHAAGGMPLSAANNTVASSRGR
ncbi:MAG TPA: putative capsular polysaccharide synthesis family protein [Dongiaceae bacterium]|nr:putative capsular polysaccharide synthesis family protein [Dongiaceae bacterium]